MSKKFTKWKSFDFGPETSVDEGRSLKKKRKSFDNTSNASRASPRTSFARNNSNIDFFKLIEPKTPSDLMIHSKKVQEVEGWLKHVIEQKQRLKTEFCLLTGPTGSGKTCTIQTLCKTMGVEVAEWTNPVDIDYEILRGPGQVTKFLDFFTESKYCSLLSKNDGKKVIIVKDFPNVFVRNPMEFHNILEDISYKATHPVVFICTDSNSNETNLQRHLFPEEVLLKNAISHFVFNACAQTLLKKGLKRAVSILELYPDTFKTPSINTIEAILVSSMGDIRCALNQLYLASVVGKKDLPLVTRKFDSATTKKRRHETVKTVKHMVKDETLGLFHGLGRVLNPKRRQEGTSWRLNCDLQRLVDEFSIQPLKFTEFLFENYAKYFGSLEEAQKASEMLSLSSQLMENWSNHETLVLALWISVLGCMIFNEHKVSKWNQIKGPKKLAKVCSSDDGLFVHPTDRYYYNLISKTEKYYTFKNC
ncbi:cell cycle checkpoint protein RAD17 [Anthonomus grandis grandis]|uniref:cell cycle checkpoint protein RAD17 n=1 Tax=Anthonomus grandis grandis TaxID=2921223 RepID=UPI002166B15F|nr:cell cycle checkpoint protein RAD17 [Anthonomus grandis grandis]